VLLALRCGQPDIPRCKWDSGISLRSLTWMRRALAQTPSSYFLMAFDNPALDRPSQINPRTRKIPISIRQATPVNAVRRNASLNVTARVPL